MKPAYQAWAAHYDHVENPTRDLDAAVVREVLRGIDANEVLEVGCGTGKNTGFLAERYRSVTALDFSSAMLAEARGKLGRNSVDFVQHDILEPWPLEPDRFDLVTCNLILEHIEDLRPIYREAARVLRTGGRLFLCEIHPYRQLRGAGARVSWPDSEESAPIRVYLHSLAEYINQGVAAGLRVHRVGEWHGEGDETPRLVSVLFGC